MNAPQPECSTCPTGFTTLGVGARNLTACGGCVTGNASPGRKRASAQAPWGARGGSRRPPCCVPCPRRSALELLSGSRCLAVSPSRTPAAARSRRCALMAKHPAHLCPIPLCCCTASDTVSPLVAAALSHQSLTSVPSRHWRRQLHPVRPRHVVDRRHRQRPDPGLHPLPRALHHPTAGRHVPHALHRWAQGPRVCTAELYVGGGGGASVPPSPISGKGVRGSTAAASINPSHPTNSLLRQPGGAASLKSRCGCRLTISVGSQQQSLVSQRKLAADPHTHTICM